MNASTGALTLRKHTRANKSHLDAATQRALSIIRLAGVGLQAPVAALRKSQAWTFRGADSTASLPARPATTWKMMAGRLALCEEFVSSLASMRMESVVNIHPFSVMDHLARDSSLWTCGVTARRNPFPPHAELARAGIRGQTGVLNHRVGAFHGTVRPRRDRRPRLPRPPGTV